MKIKALILLLFLMVMTSCAAPQSGVFLPVEGKNSATVTVVGADGKMILENTAVSFDDGATAFDATRFILKEKKIHMEFSGVSLNRYVKAIDNLYEFSQGAASGWLYSVNDSYENSDVSSSKYILKDGDSVKWVFTTNLGKDAGADGIGN